MNITDEQWTAYRLCHPDHEGKSYEKAAKEMGVSVDWVRILLMAVENVHPDLFTDISSDGRWFDHGVSRYGGWCEGDVKKQF